MRERISVSANGEPLSFMTDWWGDSVLTTRRNGGSFELSWRMDLPRRFFHPDLVRGADVVGKVGGSRVFAGTLSEPDMDSGEFIAQGLCRQAETASALDLSGATSHPGNAVYFGNARGLLDWGSLETFTALTDSELTKAPNTIYALLEAYAAELGRNWMVDDNGLLFTYDDPTVPRWSLPPGLGVLGVADDDYWTNLVGVYTNKKGRYKLVYSSDPEPIAGFRERNVDLTKLGRITPARAQAKLDAMLEKGLARTGWTNSIQVSRGDVTNMSGALASLSMVRGGHMVHLPDVPDPRGRTGSTDVVVDETVLNFAEESLEIKPVGLAARDLGAVIASMGGVLE